MPNDEVDASTPTAGVDFDELEKLAKIGAIPPKAIDDLTKEAGYYDSGERSFSRRDIIGNITGEPNPEYRDKILGILKTNQGVVAPAKPASPGEAPPPRQPSGETPPKPQQGTGTGQVTGTGPEPEVTVEPLPEPKAEPKAEPEKKAEPKYKGSDDPRNDPNYKWKKDDYRGADGVEDMETGTWVKPDAPKGNLSHLKTFAGSGKGGLRNDPDEVDAIKQLQKKLGIEADGKYGSNTKDAVKKFQEKHGLAVDGDAGPETIGKMIELQKPSEPPKPIPNVTKDEPQEPKAIPKVSGQSSTSDPFKLYTAEGMRGLQDKIMNIAKD
jgi:peptidoglycan hydrolase-like protein with peptidoglycan-binding domain